MCRVGRMNNKDHNSDVTETTPINDIDHLIENDRSNHSKSRYTWLKILFTTIMILVGSSSVVFLSLGKTIGNWTRCTNCIPQQYSKDCDYFKCDDFAGFTIGIALMLSFLFWQFPPSSRKYHIFCCGDFANKLRWKPYLTMLIMYLIVIGLVLLAHGIGYGLLNHLYHVNEFFTWRTSLAGFQIYTAIIVGLFILFMILVAFCS
jgi:preprotein translocase subunit SecG